MGSIKMLWRACIHVPRAMSWKSWDSINVCERQTHRRLKETRQRYRLKRVQCVYCHTKKLKPTIKPSPKTVVEEVEKRT
jgi:hypothetical protein